jgi:hypothetical protein
LLIDFKKMSGRSRKWLPVKPFYGGLPPWPSTLQNRQPFHPIKVAVMRDHGRSAYLERAGQLHGVGQPIMVPLPPTRQFESPKTD